MLMRSAAAEYKWNLNYGGIALMWRGGCIIRSRFLGKIKEAYDRQHDLPNLLLDPNFNAYMQGAQANWRRAVNTAIQAGIPVPAFSASISYFDAYRTENLPLNLTQAQRDFFGSHTYQRTDRPDAGFVHTEWEELLEQQSK
jgi:6-phosphogluconate dehydrogenase